MSSDHREHIGEIIRVNGPIVEARHMEHAGMLEVVEVGTLRLIGEVIKVHRGAATIQVYEIRAVSGPAKRYTARPGRSRYGSDQVCWEPSMTASRDRWTASPPSAAP